MTCSPSETTGPGPRAISVYHSQSNFGDGLSYDNIEEIPTPTTAAAGSPAPNTGLYSVSKVD